MKKHFYSRLEEIKFTRLRLGHTRLLIAIFSLEINHQFVQNAKFHTQLIIFYVNVPDMKMKE